MSASQARATRSGFQPVLLGFSEKPNPGMDGRTRWKASSAVPPWAVGSVKGPMVFSNSKTDPGQPWVMISGMAFGWRERTWMK
ncbi:hypothetical protein FQZ97_832410 [compost metagenome]